MEGVSLLAWYCISSFRYGAAACICLLALLVSLAECVLFKSVYSPTFELFSYLLTEATVTLSAGFHSTHMYISYTTALTQDVLSYWP